MVKLASLRHAYGKLRQNVGKEKQYGVEMMFESQWLPNLSTHLGYTYINAQIKNDPTQKYVTEIPKHSILAGVKYSPLNPLDLIANLRYQSKTYASSEIQYEDYTNKSFTLVDLRVAYRVIKDLELAV